MLADILDSLDDLGYNGPLLEEAVLQEAVKNGAKSQQLTSLVEFLTKEISQLAGIDEFVRAINNEADSDNFLLELNGFLREYGCPYSSLTEGNLNERLNRERDCSTLLDYLCTELQALRMTAVDNPNLLTVVSDQYSKSENELARILKQILITLQFSKPPPNVTISQIFMKIETKVKEIVGKVGSQNFPKGILKSRLSSKNLESVSMINSALKQDYSTRRDMLIKRFDVTVQSFQWSDRAKAKEDEIQRIYQPVKNKLQAQSTIDIEHILAAREDLLTVGKTSSGIDRERTKTKLNRVLIGSVPDRGGRVYEHDIPPPEMPAFTMRQAAPQPQRQSSGRGGGGRGRGQHQGNYHHYGSQYTQQGYQGGSNTDAFFGGQKQNFQGQFQPQFVNQDGGYQFDGRKNFGSDSSGRRGNRGGRGGRGGRW